MGIFVRDLFNFDINCAWKLGVYDSEKGYIIGIYTSEEIENHEEWFNLELNGYITIKKEDDVPYIYFELTI